MITFKLGPLPVRVNPYENDRTLLLWYACPIFNGLSESGCGSVCHTGRPPKAELEWCAIVNEVRRVFSCKPGDTS